ncbi:hypothetical protein [Amnibacterium kyonggiense]|uniref:Uncharacterized protein n=1 Tax=Amnibacterium kyonggiense TaxID=595671 RepID=A0A4R7FLP8_9MICO|nr:hypothetical protein [Amnibacterium kyonggiense]TDS77313.1 hypothetical protein CLV52_2257 [Amnibacterium kyonggiense]
MSVELVVLLALAVAAVTGIVAGVVALLRRAAERASRLEADPTTPRVAAEVHAGEEQVLIHLARALELPSDRDDVAYGQIYIVGSAGMTLKLASRSEIGRGLDAEVRVQRTRRASLAEYYVLRLPGDESLHDDIVDLDGRIAAALHTLDPEAHVRRAGRAAVG